VIYLEKKYLDTIQQILQRWVPDYEVWAFGSRVHQRGLKPFSDLDLVLITKQPLDMSHYAIVKEAFNESDLPFRVDITDWSQLSDSFKEMIRNEHEQIQ
jgi:predicted nucleotidyltransferase